MAILEELTTIVSEIGPTFDTATIHTLTKEMSDRLFGGSRETFDETQRATMCTMLAQTGITPDTMGNFIRTIGAVVGTAEFGTLNDLLYRGDCNQQMQCAASYLEMPDLSIHHAYHHLSVHLTHRYTWNMEEILLNAKKLDLVTHAEDGHTFLHDIHNLGHGAIIPQACVPLLAKVFPIKEVFEAYANAVWHDIDRTVSARGVIQEMPHALPQFKELGLGVPDAVLALMNAGIDAQHTLSFLKGAGYTISDIEQGWTGAAKEYVATCFDQAKGPAQE